MSKPQTETLRASMTLGDEPTEGGPRPFRMLAYTGAQVSRLWGSAVFDLAGIKVNTPLPILLNHDSDKIVGHATSAKLTDEGLLLEGVVSDKTPEGRMVAALGHDGFPWTASVGLADLQWEDVSDGETVEINGQKLTGPIAVARSAECFETSFLSAGPADRKTAVAVLKHENKEGPMTPDEKFAAEHPAAVEAWQEEGRAAAVAGLESLQAAFPGRTDLVLLAYTRAKGCELKARAELAALLHEALAQADAPEPKSRATKADKVAKLAAEAGSPGLGFNGVAREQLGHTAETVSLTPEDRYARSAQLQAEFPTLGSYLAWAKRNQEA